MKVLIACEESGTVRDAFIAQGHEAMSCDLLPTRISGPHYQGDVRDVLDFPWDLMIAHPPCTHLSVSGSLHFPAKKLTGRQQAAVSFFMMLAKSDIPKIAIENPIGIMSTLWRKPDQIIQPYEFGEDASKATCLWLKGLSKLTRTQRIQGRLVNGRERWANQTDSGQNKLGPSDTRAKERSVTYPGIANAMATQWSSALEMRMTA